MAHTPGRGQAAAWRPPSEAPRALWGIPCLQEQPHTGGPRLPLSPVTENNSDIPKLQSWGVGAADASEQLSPTDATQLRRPAARRFCGSSRSTSSWLCDAGTHLASLGLSFHVCRWPVRFPVVPQLRTVSQPQVKGVGARSRRENPTATLPPVLRGQAASVLEAKGQPAGSAQKFPSLRVAPSLGVSKPDLQRTGAGVAHIPTPVSRGGHGSLSASS